MRTYLASAVVFLMMIVPAIPPAAATHGDTAYLIGLGGTVFVAETYYVTGPGYLDQFWDFNIIAAAAAGTDRCPLAHGGWDPDPRPPPIGNPGPSGFSGSCNSGLSISTTGTDHYHPYPNAANGCAPVPGCQGFDIHEVSVTYAGSTFQAQLVVCDNRVNPVLNRVSASYCNDILLLNQF